MQSLILEDLPYLGALEVERTPDGVVLHRLPAWARAQTAEPMVGLVESMPAGIRLGLRTSSTVLELDVALTCIQIADRDPMPATFEVVAGGAVTQSVSTAEGNRIVIGVGGTVEIVPGPPTTVRLDLPGDPGTYVEVWLPHAAGMTLLGARVDEGTDLAPVGSSSGRRWVHHGSSISHCLEATGPTQTWPAIVAREAGFDLQNLGFAGQCMLDGFTARTIRDLPADLMSLKVGINVINGDTFRERTFVPALHAFLDTVRDGHPDTPLVVVTPIVFPAAEQAPGPSVVGDDGLFTTVPRSPELSIGALTMERVRELVTAVVTARQATDPHLHLLSGLALFGEEDVALLHDGLHPSAEGYRLMGERFLDLVCRGDGPFAGMSQT